MKLIMRKFSSQNRPPTHNMERTKNQEENATTTRPTALFVFPSAAGHVNPSLPLCERLASEQHYGWKVHYLCIGAFREKIEKTGAIFHDRNDVLRRRLGGGRDNDDPDFDVTKMIYQTLEEYNDGGSSNKSILWGLNFGSITTERLLPAYIDFFEERSPRLVVYCPVLCLVANLAAMRLGIPAVSLLTAAGPGWVDAAFASAYGREAVNAAKRNMIEEIRSNRPNRNSIEKIRSLMEPVWGNKKQLAINTSDSEPLINEYYAPVNIVTTVRSLSDSLTEEDALFYDEAGKTFRYVGPLLMPEQQVEEKQQRRGGDDKDEDDNETASMFRAVERAVADGRRKIVYVSMGTVVTSGGDPDNGWNGRTAGSRSLLTGKQLCHSVYRAVFSELGSRAAKNSSSAGSNNEQGENPPPVLLIASVGSEPDALEGIDVPDNAVCMRSVPQVDLLRAAGPALAAFVTNGGQNSFMEGLSVGVPLLVCPGFGDQFTNANRATSLGVGRKVDRPMKTPTTAMPVDDGDDKENAAAERAEVVEAVAGYEKQVSAALRELLSAKEIDDDDRFGGAASAGVNVTIYGIVCKYTVSNAMNEK